MNCILRGVRVIDPAAGLDLAGQDVWLSEGRIIAIYRQIDEGTVPVIDLTPAPGQSPCILAPGFIDLHAHLREPGDEAAETIASGAAAAAAGGYTHVVAMANTDPPVDTPERVEQARRRAGAAPVAVMVAAAATRGLAGAEVVDIEGCAAAGAVAFSDDGRNGATVEVLAEVLGRAADVSRTVLVHPEDEAIIAARAPAGSVLTRAGERPELAETSAVRAALDALARAGRGRLHLQHLSTAASVELVRRAREDGMAVTAEVTPHHLGMWLPLAQPPEPAALVKVNPPLRGEHDRRALIEGLRDGVIDAVATDHAPHRMDQKTGPMAAAAPGMTGLETALATCITLGGMGGDWIPVLVERLTAGPHRVLGGAAPPREPRLRVGETATCVLFDPAAEWTVGEPAPHSRSLNTPLLGVRLRGRVLLTIIDGVIAHQDESRLAWAAQLLEIAGG
ncbi:MAG TPA: dihydroorotase [Candidatus Dormibacteraeota bacterium]|nr:dihydroorotase [Candidatus Dormibacteraeota bacterium]